MYDYVLIITQRKRYRQLSLSWKKPPADRDSRAFSPLYEALSIREAMVVPRMVSISSAAFGFDR